MIEFLWRSIAAAIATGIGIVGSGTTSKRTSLLLAIALFPIAGRSAFAATYNYTGPLYNLQNPDSNLGTNMSWSITLDCGGTCSNFTGVLTLSPNGASSAGSSSPGVISAGVTSFEMTSGNATLSLASNNLPTNITDSLAFSDGAIIGWNLGLTTSNQYLLLSNYDCSTGGVSCYWFAEDSAYDNTAGKGANVFVSATSGNLPVVATTPLPSTWTMMLIGLAGLGFVGYRQGKKAALPAAA